MSWARQFEANQKDAKIHSLNPHSKTFAYDQWVNIFSDGVVERDTGKATAGEVIQDKNDNWIMGFNHFLGTCTPFEAEL